MSMKRTLLVSLEVISEEQKRVYEMDFAARRIKLYFPTAKVFYRMPYNMAFIATLEGDMAFEDAIYNLGALANELGQDCVSYAYNATGKAFDACGLVGERSAKWGTFSPEYFPFALTGYNTGGLEAGYRLFHSTAKTY